MCLLQLPRSAWELIPYAPRHRATGPYKTTNGRGAWERSMRAAPGKAIRHLVARTPSGGRVEVLRRGTSRRDAARGVKGHGRPLYAGPRSGTGRRGVERSETRMPGCVSLPSFLCTSKESRSPSRAKPCVRAASEAGLRSEIVIPEAHLAGLRLRAYSDLPPVAVAPRSCSSKRAFCALIRSLSFLWP